MAISTLDKMKLRSVLTVAWQKKLDTNLDPVGGGWLETNPNKVPGGLFGLVTDRRDPNIIYDTASSSTLVNKEFVNRSKVDNRNGLLTSPQYTLLQKTYTKTVTHGWAVSVAVKVGVSASLKGWASVIVAGAELTVGGSFDVTVTGTYSGNVTESNSYTAGINRGVLPPAGKVYEIVMSCYSGTTAIPFTVRVYIEGTTEAWFHYPVKGSYAHSMSIQEALDIYNSFNKDSPYLKGQDGVYYIESFRGVLNASFSANFEAEVVDITDRYAMDEGVDSEPAKKIRVLGEKDLNKPIRIKSVPAV